MFINRVIGEFEDAYNVDYQIKPTNHFLSDVYLTFCCDVGTNENGVILDNSFLACDDKKDVYHIS